MSSTRDVTVDIDDENDNPSSDRKLGVVVKTFDGVFPGGKVFKATPQDLDDKEKAEFKCKMIKGSENIFQVGTSF